MVRNVMKHFTWEMIGWGWAILGGAAGFYCIRMALRDHYQKLRVEAAERDRQNRKLAIDLSRNRRFLEDMGIQPYEAEEARKR